MTYTIQQISDINSILEKHGSGKHYPVFVDNLHTSFIQLDNSYRLPSTSVFSVDFAAARDYVSMLAEVIPQAVSGSYILQNHRPKRETGKITLFKDFDFNGAKYLYVNSFHVAYLGGASADSIVLSPIQERTAAVKTERIYFSSRIVPLDEIEYFGGVPTDFKTRQYDESKVMVSTSVKNPRKESISELFDEVDYSDIIRSLKEIWKISADLWKPGRIFDPIAVEYYTVCFRFLNIDREQNLQDFSAFYTLTESLFSDTEIKSEAIENIHKWLKSHDVERVKSPSGNMSWKINRNRI